MASHTRQADFEKLFNVPRLTLKKAPSAFGGHILEPLTEDDLRLLYAMKWDSMVVRFDQLIEIETRARQSGVVLDLLYFQLPADHIKGRLAA